jgi:hypothetical protein
VTIAPKRTVAVVVGIEEYAAGHKWRLDGPALDACRFASWLVDRGVPAANITLLLSPSPDNARTVKTLSAEFEVEPATESAIRDVLFTRLAASDSDLLVLFWGGHGVTDDADDPLLLYADAKVRDKRNLNLRELLLSMRTRTFDGHPQQLVLVDACLNFTTSLRWSEGIPKDERYTRGDQDTQRDQQVLLAASLGEAALNDDAEQTGLFSEVVREALAKTPIERWPPDPDELRSTVTERFRVLRNDGRTQQVPSYIWFKSRHFDDKQRLELPGALRESLLLDRSEHRTLKNILMSAAAPASLRAIYREAAQTVPSLPRRPEYPDDLMSSVDTLRAAVNPKPLFEFLVRLAVDFTKTAHERLWNWIRATAPNYGIKLRDLEELNEELRRTYFVLRVEPDLLGSGFQITVWRFAGTTGSQVVAADAPWSQTRLAEELGRLVEEFDGDPDIPLPIVEFVLPFELLDDDFEALPVRFGGQEQTIGTVCPVVVRPLDRITQPDWHQAWQDNWRELDTHCHRYDPAAIYWADCVGVDPFDSTCFTGHVCLALAYDREVRPHEDPILRSTLNAGIPVALWHRTCTGGRTRRQALEQVLSAWALKLLPDRVHRQRVAAREDDTEANHAGRDLVLMWDDPNRIPSDMEWHPPSLEGAAP